MRPEAYRGKPMERSKAMHARGRASRVLTLAAGVALACTAGLGGGCRSTSKLPRMVPVTKELRSQAETASAAGKWDLAAQRWWSIFVASQEKDEQACAETARAMLHLADPESAIGVLKQGLVQHPESAQLHELHGDALVQRSYRRAAESCYQEAVKFGPQRASAWRALGKVRLELGYEKSAIAPLRRAVELGIDDSAIWLLVARASRGAGEVCESFDAYKRAFAAGTSDAATYIEASTLCLESTVCRTNPDAVSVSRAWLQQAVENEPQSTQAHFQLGVLAEVESKIDEAVEHYRRAAEITPDFLPALRNLALIYAQRHDVPNTRNMVERALKLERDPDRRRALEKLLEPITGVQPPPPAPTDRG